MWDFEHQPTPEITANFEISYTVPSSCAQSLREGTADIGIIPVITTAAIPDLVILPEIAIAARHAVRSILLVTEMPLQEVRTVAVDSSSRTSVALAQILLTAFYGGHRKLLEMPPSLPFMLTACDAALLIGDAALTARTQGCQVYDLAQLWRQHTGKAFVFAVWAVRRAALEEMQPGLDLSGIFRRSRDHGLEPASMAHIAREWSHRLGLPEADITSYLRQNVHYQLDAECMEGLHLFFDYAKQFGLIPKVPKLKFMESPKRPGHPPHPH